MKKTKQEYQRNKKKVIKRKGGILEIRVYYYKIYKWVN